MNRMNKAYLVSDAYLLTMQEKPDGVDYHCFDNKGQTKIAEGHLGWDVLDAVPISTLDAAARMAALDEIGLSSDRIAVVSLEMLERMQGGRKILGQMKKADPDLANSRNIRFIDSSYNEKFKIPDGGVVEVEYPDRKFSARCEYMDDYHLRLGFDVLHICQLAEMLERGGGTCRPEPIITAEQTAWEVGRKGFLAIQTCDDGYDYTLYNRDFSEIDGGQIDNPELTMNEARNQILADYGFGGHTMRSTDYDDLIDHGECAETEKRESILGKLADTPSRTDTPAKASHKAKEAER